MEGKEKLDQVVGVPLSSEQREELREIIRKWAPDMSEGRMLRIAWLNFRQQLYSRGPIHLVGEVMGA
jgi:hypothetical protein